MDLRRRLVNPTTVACSVLCLVMGNAEIFRQAVRPPQDHTPVLRAATATPAARMPDRPRPFQESLDVVNALQSTTASGGVPDWDSGYTFVADGLWETWPIRDPRDQGWRGPSSANRPAIR